MGRVTTSHQRKRQVSGPAPQGCPLAQDELDQDEWLEGGIFILAQGRGPEIQAEWPCVRKQAVPARWR